MSLLSNKKDNEIAKLKSEIAKKDNDIEELQLKLKEFEEINGSIISFDFDTEALKKYYHEDKNITNAYNEIRRFLERREFKHLKDSDYKSNKPTWYAEKIIKDFAKDEKNKWFPLFINKYNVSPNRKTLI